MGCFFVLSCTEKKNSDDNIDLNTLTKIQILAVQAQAQLLKSGPDSMTSDLRCRLNLSQAEQKDAEENILKTLRSQKNLTDFLKRLFDWSNKGPAEKLTRFQILQTLDPIKDELCLHKGCADSEFKSYKLNSIETYEEIKKLKTMIEKQFPTTQQDLNPGSCFN